MDEFLLNIIKEAGGILLRSFGEQYDAIYKVNDKYKDYPQSVTGFDNKINLLLIKRINQEFPSHNIYSEESDAKYKSEGYTWIIDPIDGTTHFSRGIPLFSISIALQYQQEIILGAVYAPYLDYLYFAKKNYGATCNGEKIKVSKISSIDKALVMSSVFQSYKINNFERQFNEVVNSIINLRMYAASALDMCYVASGKAEARIFSNTEIWDHAAASLIVEEAGGKVTDWNGDRWTLKTKSLLVTNNILHEKILNILNR